MKGLCKMICGAVNRIFFQQAGDNIAHNIAHWIARKYSNKRPPCLTAPLSGIFFQQAILSLISLIELLANIQTRCLSAWQLRCLIVYATLMMSNCLWYSQINTQWSWFDLSMPPKVKYNGLNWKTIYDLLYVFHARFDKKMLHLGDATFWKSCDLDFTLKGYPMSIVLR